MAPRSYQKRRRAEAEEETRRRILDAVYQQLREKPAEPVSVERVAGAAGVSRSTVYLVFGSRAGLFDAVGDDLRGRGGFNRMPADGEADARTSLLESVRASVSIFAEHRDVLRALYSMSQLDGDAVGGAIERMAADRAAGMAWHAQRLADQDVLRAGLSVADAAHLLWAVTGFEFFDQLYAGRGLPADAVAELMVAAVEHLVL
ncbi:TetR/AcrR family transcriptional regulator [Fodinicola acaciae]|uniref:TetR/AcrR family transcriptional regulator n=1 Tax=Fodinicola acaciae TaxID=2681555 RepID=UPI0013D7D21C|nr:TetR/AcrR family transcriptional regulator [Fodinicola acaciae]